jgi:acyl-CoA hydrolase
MRHTRSFVARGKEHMMRMARDARAALDLLRPGLRVYVAGCFGEPTGFLDALAREPDRGAGVTFTGVFIPGVNRRDPSAGPREAQVETFFVTPDLADGFDTGRVRYLPLHYSAIVRRFAEPHRLDLAVMRVSPPNAQGEVSFGVAADFSPDIARLAIPLVAEIDATMPFAADGPTCLLDRFALAYEAAHAPRPYSPGASTPALQAIGRRIAALIEPGDTIQLGLGKVHTAVLDAIGDHRDLRYHGGMIIDGMIPLIDRGVMTEVTTGAALGGAVLVARCGVDRRVRFRPVSMTHDIRTLAAIPRFTAINSALAVDLYGQVAADMLDGRPVSGIGGLVDFHRGGMTAAGGRSIIALPASGPAGSRIVPVLPPGAPPALGRADAMLVVTEHGVADLRGLDVDSRAERLISLADPAQRDSLADAWAGMRRGMGRERPR